MSIPKNFLKALSREAPQRFEDIDQLTYIGAVALSAQAIADPRLNAYVHYFKAEQEGDHLTADRLHALEESAHLSEAQAQVVHLIRGRRLLQKPRVTLKEVESWLADALQSLGQDQIAYAYFLAGIGCLEAKSPIRASQFLRQSAVEYERRGKRSRELQSLLPDPELTESEIRYLKSYARKLGDLKSYHVADLALASLAARFGNHAEAQHYARASVHAFRNDFLDPRRASIAQDLISLTSSINSKFTTMELRLLKRLESGPCTKHELLHSLYGGAARYACQKSVDARFRTLLSRLRKKSKGRVISRDGTYQLGM